MHLHGDHLAMRLFGTLIGIGFLLFGMFAVIGPGDPVTVENQEKALWFGVHLIVAGAAAIFASWIMRDLDGVWCRQLSRWGSDDR